MIVPLMIDNDKTFRSMGFDDHMTLAASDSAFAKNMPTVRLIQNGKRCRFPFWAAAP